MPLVPTVIALDVAVAVGAKAVAQRITGGACAAFAVPLDDAAGKLRTVPREYYALAEAFFG